MLSSQQCALLDHLTDQITTELLNPGLILRSVKLKTRKTGILSFGAYYRSAIKTT